MAEVNYSARIVFQELRAQRGYTGSYETLKLAVRPLREAAASGQLTQRRFETEPGEQAQVDWGQLSVMLGERRATVHVMVMTLGYRGGSGQLDRFPLKIGGALRGQAASGSG